MEWHGKVIKTIKTKRPRTDKLKGTKAYKGTRGRKRHNEPLRTKRKKNYLNI